MEKDVQKRFEFRDVSFDKCPDFLEYPVKYIRYDLYETLPDFDSVRDGEIHTIVLKNKETNNLEEIEYLINPFDDEVSGGVRFSNPELGYQGYDWIYAYVKTNDHRATLNFRFNRGGECVSATILVSKTWSPEKENLRER